MQTRTVDSEIEMAIIAEEIYSILPKKMGAQVLTLKGELGAGKTTFVKAFAQILGITEHITSPTFVLMKHYAIPKHKYFHTLTHIDAYRVEDVDELRILDLPTLYSETGRIICIEWPERMLETLPDDVLRMSIEIGAQGTRTVTYSSYGNT